MKKIFALSLIGVLAISLLSGCGLTGAEGSAPAGTAVPSEEIIAGKVSEPIIQAGDTIIKLGESTVTDLAEAGAEFSADSQVESLEFSEDPLYQRAMDFTIGDTVIHTQIKNMKDEAAPISESVVLSAYWEEGAAVVGVGGVMLGDTLEDVQKKLGDPYLIVNSEDYYTQNEGASMIQNGRVWCYATQYDDINVRVCIDRNTSTVNLIEEVLPLNLITEPKMADDTQIQDLITAHDKDRSSVLSGYIADETTLEGGTISVELQNIKYNKIKVLTLNDVHDSKQLYLNRQSSGDGAVATTYLFVEFSATAIDGDEESRPVVGGFYIPNAYINDAGEIASAGTDYNNGMIDVEGFYKSEDKMLSDMFPDAEQGYTISDFTVMERAIG